MHSVIIVEDTGHMDTQRNKSDKRKILYGQHSTEENQVK